MGQGTGRFAWGRHLAVVIAYAACYVLLRSVSVSNWNLPAGLRLACLLLMPYRYWPALILGEVLPVGYEAWLCREQFGGAWVGLAAIPPIALCAPVVAWCRHRGALFLAGRQINVSLVLAVALLGAVLTTAGNTLALAFVQLPGGTSSPAITLHVVFGYFLGNYLGALTLLPAMLALRQWLAERPRKLVWTALSRDGSAFARDCMVGLVPVLLVLTWFASTDNLDTMQVCRISMFLPVAWLTMRHGWRGAAFGGMLASIAVAVTSTTVRDPAVIQAQALIAFAISTLLMLGSRLAQPSNEARDTAADAQPLGFQLAQQSLYLEEVRLRHFAEVLEHLGQSVSEQQNRLLERLRNNISVSEERNYFRRAAVTQHEMHRLAKALYPRTVLERGLCAALQDGPFARAVATAGATYKCDLSGSGLNLLAPEVQMALYRLACEALVHVLARAPATRVRLQGRSGESHGRRWAVLRVSCEHLLPSDKLAQSTAEDLCRQAMSLLGASGLEPALIRDRAHIYGGDMHLREKPESVSITLLLHDTRHSAPTALSDEVLTQVASLGGDLGRVHASANRVA